MSDRKKDQSRSGDAEIVRLFAQYESLRAKENAGSGILPEAEEAALHKAGAAACQKAARMPASGFAGLLAKVDYIISQEACIDTTADLALKCLRGDLAHMLKESASSPLNDLSQRELMRHGKIHALSEIWHSAVWLPVITRLIGEAINTSDESGAMFLSNCLTEEVATFEARYKKAELMFAPDDPKRLKKKAKKGGGK